VSETLAAALARITAQLGDAGLADPRREARQILSFVTGLDPAGLIAHESAPIEPELATHLDRMVAGRVARRPLAHLTGDVAFHGIGLRSDARALVPRSDSECVVDAALDRLDANRGVQVGDLGTGTGCLLLSILAARPRRPPCPRVAARVGGGDRRFEPAAGCGFQGPGGAARARAAPGQGRPAGPLPVER